MQTPITVAGKKIYFFFSAKKLDDIYEFDIFILNVIKIAPPHTVFKRDRFKIIKNTESNEKLLYSSKISTTE